MEYNGRTTWPESLRLLIVPSSKQLVVPAKRLVGTRLLNKKEPISPDMIRKLVEASNFNNLLGLRNVCIFLLAFAGFFRIEEVLHIKYGDIAFHADYVAISTDRSKTDQLRKGNEVVISENFGSDSCPVRILSRYLNQVRPFLVDSAHFVFRALSKTKSSHKLVAVNKPISYSSVRYYFKKSFKDIVPDISVFSTHSLRAGGASAAANAGVADRLFQRHGRWKYVSAKNGYVEDSLESRLSVSKNLGI